ncbi:hypothetical protein GCM10027280_51700 [Micromonospora polyrhachis]|uniref:Amino acid transporter n=1 Tax=Micromonospora polyrhachis TaxID=1282883 RepID=A0A7W7SW05_9ACTN|nr:APC family permease [Micromonospora polyrhachis]MBB4962005.1 amino acid transporter [Micromonospora polyrhachis]
MGEQAEQRGGGTSEQPVTQLNPSAELPQLSTAELDLLRQTGQRWTEALRGRRSILTTLPVDPGLGRYRSPPSPTRFGRFVPVELFQPAEPNELVATPPAVTPESVPGRVLTRLRRAVLGPPLTSAAVVHERMRKLVALPVLSSDLLSSVAYGPEAMLTVLALAGSASLGLSLPVAAALVVLMIVVGVSYRQIIPAYPHGAGSYVVASDNLGSRLGLTAAAGLMIDYVLTVAVSVASGIHAITSALPHFSPWAVPMGLVAIVVLLAGNLRGLRTAGNIFAAPTYLFVVAIVVLVVVGLAQAAGRGFAPVSPPAVPATQEIGVLLILLAFSSGATSMTGIEAISNAVPAFRPPEGRNGRTTLTWMISLLVVMFVGLILLIHLDGVVPRSDQTVLSQLVRQTFPTGPWYALIQGATALILLLAANTAFNGFPRLLFFVARDGYAPRRFLHLGDRLAFSNGMIALAVAAAILLVAFQGHTESLIPLFAVGVFLAITLSQTGMVVHWRRRRGPHWRKRLWLNALGAALSGVVLLTAATTKFTEGAWVVVVAVPVLIGLGWRVRRHYDTVNAQLAPHPGRIDATHPVHPPPTGILERPAPPGAESGPRPESGSRPGAESGPRPGDGAETGEEAETEETPQEIWHFVVVPVERLNLAALRALAYAVSIGQPVLAVHISPDEDEADRFRRQWDTWGDHLRLEVIVSPYRAIVAPLARYLEALHASRPELTLTVVLPEIVVRQWWHRLLHSNVPRRLRQALRQRPGIVVTTVPIHVPQPEVTGMSGVQEPDPSR